MWEPSPRTGSRPDIWFSLFAYLSACRLQQLARDDELLDLRGALEDAKKPDVAIEALDRIFGHVAGTTKYLTARSETRPTISEANIFAQAAFRVVFSPRSRAAAESRIMQRAA